MCLLAVAVACVLAGAKNAARLDELTGGWLRALPGGWENLLRAIAIDGQWLRGIGDGQQVRLFAAMLHRPSDATGPACSTTYR